MFESVTITIANHVDEFDLNSKTVFKTEKLEIFRTQLHPSSVTLE